MFGTAGDQPSLRESILPYHHSTASTYNMVGRPPLVGVRDGRARVLGRRESTADLLARDLG